MSALIGSVGLLAIGVIVYMVILPALAFLIISGTADHTFAFDGPKSFYCILTLSLAGGFFGWSMYQLRKRI